MSSPIDETETFTLSDLLSFGNFVKGHPNSVVIEIFFKWKKEKSPTKKS